MLLTTPLGTREAHPCIGAKNGGWRGYKLRWSSHSHLLTPCRVINPSPSKVKLQDLIDNDQLKNDDGRPKTYKKQTFKDTMRTLCGHYSSSSSGIW